LEGVSAGRATGTIGAVALAVLAGTMALTLWASGRVFGGVVIRAQATTIGPLRVGTKVRLAGEIVGEVRSIGATATGIEANIALTAKVPRNCRLFVALPSVLGEAHLTFAPPDNNAPPEPPFVDQSVADREARGGAEQRSGRSGTLSGFQATIDAPPDIDRLLARVDDSLRQALLIFTEEQPAWAELRTATRSLDQHAREVSLGEHAHSIVDQTRQAIEAARELVAAVRHAGGPERILAVARKLGEAADALAPQLRALGTQIDQVTARLGFPENASDRAQLALAKLRHSVAVGEALVTDVKKLIKRIEAGQGTVGAFLADKEIYDDFHDTHRIIKANPLRFLLPTVKDGKRR
jgi:ABC-type transporter Mla subunit MlaD